jgi:hypothetical protein
MSDTTPWPESVSIPTTKAGWVVPALLGLASASALVSATGWSADPRRFAFSYLTAFLFVTSLGVGSLAWLMIQHVTGAVWSVSLRRLLENLTRPLFWIALLFIPVALNVPRLYAWADTARVQADPEVARKAVWLNPVAFDVRAALYLAVWAVIAARLSRASTRQDRTGDPALIAQMRATSTWGLVALGLTTSFAGFDWVMSLDPLWSSTVFGVYVWAGSLVGSLSALILLALALRSFGGPEGLVTVEHLHDLGKLLFGFVIFWAYIAFCQYFLIWYANFPDETGWYVMRRSGAWNTISWALVFGHFVVPFFLLIPRATKRDPFWLGFVAVWALGFHYVDLYWLVMPASGTGSAEPRWLDASLLLTLVFTCSAIVARACQVQPLVPKGDPRLAESIAFSQ